MTLTPGSELRFAQGAALQIATNATYDNGSFRGELEALGTLAEPIRFVADNGQPGGWAGIRFSTSADYNGASSAVEHLDVVQAETGLELRQTDLPNLSHITIRECPDVALVLTESRPQVHNCLFSESGTGLYINNSTQTVIGDSLLWTNGFDLNQEYDLYNEGAGDVLARHNAWCPPLGQSLEDRIFDQLDDAAKGLVSYLPSAPGTNLRLQVRHDAVNELVHLEWCTYLGATAYRVYLVENGWPAAEPELLLVTTAETWLDLPLSGLPETGSLMVTAVLP